MYVDPHNSADRSDHEAIHRRIYPRHPSLAIGSISLHLTELQPACFSHRSAEPLKLAILLSFDRLGGVPRSLLFKAGLRAGRVLYAINLQYMMQNQLKLGPNNHSRGDWPARAFQYQSWKEAANVLEYVSMQVRVVTFT